MIKILGVEPRFKLFSITAELQKIEYSTIYHTNGKVLVFSMQCFTFQEIYARGIKARHLRSDFILSYLDKDY